MEQMAKEKRGNAYHEITRIEHHILFKTALDRMFELCDIIESDK